MNRKKTKKRGYGKLYLLLIGLLCIVTFTRGYYLQHHTDQLISDTTSMGLHHQLENSQSDLEETLLMERSINQFMTKWEIEGASLAIMKEGKLVYSKGFGWADKEKEIPMEVRHIFRIASLSKLVTATGVMKLYEEGKLSLSDHVFGEDGILNDSIFLNIKDPKIKKITVEHLLRHQGGYTIRGGDPLFTMPAVARDLAKTDSLTLDDLVRYASSTRLRYEPGSSNIYSNLGYVVLTKVVEKVSGMPYEEYIRDNILIPIGCLDMHIGYSEPDKQLPNEVHYHEPKDAELTPCYDGSGRMVPRSYGGCNLHVLSGAGGWVASPTELMKLIAALDPNDPDVSILNAKTIALMTNTGSGEKADKYPIGWMKTTSSDDWTRTGTLAGSSAMLKRQHNGYTWVFLTNTSSWSGSKFPKKIDAMIQNALTKVKEWPSRNLFDEDSLDQH